MKRNFTSAMRVFRLFFNVFDWNNNFEMKIRENFSLFAFQSLF